MKLSVYYQSNDDGTLFVINAETGEKLFEFKIVGSLNSGPSIVNGSIVYIESGYVNNSSLYDLNLYMYDNY